MKNGWGASLVDIQKPGLIKHLRFIVSLRLNREHIVKFNPSGWGFELRIDAEKVWSGSTLKGQRGIPFAFSDLSETRTLTITGPITDGILEGVRAQDRNIPDVVINVDGYELLSFPSY